MKYQTKTLKIFVGFILMLSFLSLGERLFNDNRMENVLSAYQNNVFGAILDQVAQYKYISRHNAQMRKLSELSSLKGSYSVTIKSISSSEELYYNYDQDMPVASLVKADLAVHILEKVYTGNDNLYSIIGDTTLNNLLQALLKRSDNTAQEILVEKYPISLQQVTTSKQVAELFYQLAVGDKYSQETKDYILSTLSITQFDNYLSSVLPSNYTFSHKVGLDPQSGTYHDCGLLYIDGTPSKIICLMSTNTTYEDFILGSKIVLSALQL